MSDKHEDKSLRERIDGLPKWAQDYVRDLTNRNQAMEKSLSEIRETKTVWGWKNMHDHGMSFGFIPDDQPVRFWLNEYEWMEVRRMGVHEGKEGKFLIYGSNAFVFGMKASNMMICQLDRKGEFH